MSLKKLEELIQKSPYPWWEWEPATDSIHFSPLKATQIGYQPEDFAGKVYGAFTALVHPQDLEKAISSMRQVLYDGAPLYQVDYRIRDKTAAYRWYMDRGYVVSRDAGGKPSRIRGIVIDLGKETAGSEKPDSAIKIISDSLVQSASGPKSFITICASCKRVKVESQTFAEISAELFHLLSEEVSHTVCIDCVRRLYPDIADKIEAEKTLSESKS